MVAPKMKCVVCFKEHSVLIEIPKKLIGITCYGKCQDGFNDHLKQRKDYDLIYAHSDSYICSFVWWYYSNDICYYCGKEGHIGRDCTGMSPE